MASILLEIVMLKDLNDVFLTAMEELTDSAAMQMYLIGLCARGYRYHYEHNSI